MIEMPIRPTLGIIPSGHNSSGVGLQTPLKVGTIVIGVIKVDASYGRCVLMLVTWHVLCGFA